MKAIQYTHSRVHAVFLSASQSVQVSSSLAEARSLKSTDVKAEVLHETSAAGCGWGMGRSDFLVSGRLREPRTTPVLYEQGSKFPRRGE